MLRQGTLLHGRRQATTVQQLQQLRQYLCAVLREPHNDAPRVVLPPGSQQAAKGRHKVDAAVVRHAVRHRLAVGCRWGGAGRGRKGQAGHEKAGQGRTASGGRRLSTVATPDCCAVGQVGHAGKQAGSRIAAPALSMNPMRSRSQLIPCPAMAMLPSSA
jgi:hypothetical protein